MNSFEFYLNEKSVKKTTIDENLGSYLIRDAKERFEKVAKLNIKEFGKIIFEKVYDALREILDALLAVNGYKSYSHEAAISFLKKFEVDDSVILQLDDFRFKRNSSKYYGKEIPEEDVGEIMKFYKKYSPSLIKLCSKMDKCSKK